MLRRVRVLVVLASLVGALTVGAAGASAANWAGLGDSYAAGPLIPNQQLNPLGCLRSDRNFAHLAAASLGRSLADVSCSGAKTDDMTAPQDVTPGPANPPPSSGCWPQVPIGFTDVPYLRGVEKNLNAMLAQQAAANGARIVDDYTASIGRDACRSAATRWVEPLVPGNAAAPFHPNARGEAGIAAVVASAVSS